MFRGDDYDILLANSSDDLCADLRIASAEDETLSADRGHNYRCSALGQQLHDAFFGKVFLDDSSPTNSVDPEHRLLES